MTANLDLRITYTSCILSHDEKKVLEIDFFDHINIGTILNFIKNSGDNITNDEYILMKRFLNEKTNKIHLFRNIYFVNRECDVKFHIVNKSLHRGNIVFTCFEKKIFRSKI